MTELDARPATGPSSSAERIDTIDVVRGVALLGIFIMNSVAFALPEAAYSNLDAAGNSTWLDTAIGAIARVFVDQKMMAIFSLLFGVGVVIFADRAAAKGRRPVVLSLWRNALLLGIGILHTIAWDGDVLTVYALCAPFVLLMRRAPAPVLAIVGLGFAVSGAVVALVTQSVGVEELGSAWTVGGGDLSDGAEGILLLDAFGRALGLMLIGVALFRWGVIQGERSEAWYRRTAMVGAIVGVGLSATGWAIHVAGDWSGDRVIDGYAISTLGTVPLALCYVSLLVLWSRRRASRLLDPLQAVGRTALTNYLMQTVFGLLVLGWLLDSVDVTRTAILGVVVLVWVAQLTVSTWWLRHFRMGPIEWLWRTATYRRREPLRR